MNLRRTSWQMMACAVFVLLPSRIVPAQARDRLDSPTLLRRGIAAYSQLPSSVTLIDAPTYAEALRYLYAYQTRTNDANGPAAIAVAWLIENIRIFTIGKGDATGVLRVEGLNDFQRAKESITGDVVWDVAAYIRASANLYAYLQTAQNPEGDAGDAFDWLQAHSNRLEKGGVKGDEWLPSTKKPPLPGVEVQAPVAPEGQTRRSEPKSLRTSVPIQLARYPDVVGVAASYNEDDGYRTVIVAQRNGDIRELYYKTAGGVLTSGIGNSVIANVQGVIDVASFYAADDQYRIVLAAASNGQLYEIYYHPNRGVGKSVIGTFSSIRAIAGFYDPGTKNRVAIILTAGSTPELWEISYNPTTGKTQRLIGRPISSVVAICANRWQRVAVTSAGYWTSVASGSSIATSGQDGLGGAKSVACGSAGFIGTDSSGIFGSLRASLLVSGSVGTYGAAGQIPAEKVALDSYDGTHIVVTAADGRVLLLVAR